MAQGPGNDEHLAGVGRILVVRHVPKGDQGRAPTYCFTRMPGSQRDVFLHRSELHGDFSTTAIGTVLYGTVVRDNDGRQGDDEPRFVARDAYLAIPHLMGTISGMSAQIHANEVAIQSLLLANQTGLQSGGTARMSSPIMSPITPPGSDATVGTTDASIAESDAQHIIDVDRV